MDTQFQAPPAVSDESRGPPHEVGRPKLACLRAFWAGRKGGLAVYFGNRTRLARRPRHSLRPFIGPKTPPLSPEAMTGQSPMRPPPAETHRKPGKGLPVGWRRDGGPCALYGSNARLPVRRCAGLPKRQPAGTGRRLPGAFGLIPGLRTLGSNGGFVLQTRQSERVNTFNMQ